jgi:hypothetical protein
MLMTIPCAAVPVMTPRRPVALVRANVAAERIASVAPKKCTAFLPAGLLPTAQCNALGLLAQW